MISKKFFLGLGLGLCSLLAVSATESKAEAGYCSGVQVVFAGAQNIGKFALLRNFRADCVGWPQNTDMWFNLENTPEQASGKLAALLSAQATGARAVVVPLDPAGFTNFGGLAGAFAQSL